MIVSICETEIKIQQRNRDLSSEQTRISNKSWVLIKYAATIVM